MNKRSIITAALLLSAGASVVPAAYATLTRNTHVAKVGEAAPDFSVSDVSGKTVSLKDYAGKFVVLEWTNHSCPYVQKQYRTGNMQATQKFAVSHGAVWLSVYSSAKGHQGYVTAEQAEKISQSLHVNATDQLLDPTGELGREYDAKTTPDIMIIDPKGVLIYSGAIDDQPTTDDEDIKTAHNYVKAALEEAMAGKPVSTPTSQPYGCSVKYGQS